MCILKLSMIEWHISAWYRLTQAHSWCPTYSSVLSLFLISLMNVHPLTHTHFHKYTHRKMARSPIDFSDVYLVYGTCFMRCTNKAMLKINTRDRTRNINYRPIKIESSSVYILGKSLPPRFYSFLFPSFFFRFPSQFSISFQSVCIACGKISWFSFHCTAKDWKGGKKS